MSDKIITISETFISDMRSILLNSRETAFRRVNEAMIIANWQAGKRIVEEEQGGKERAKYGSHLIKELSKKLTGEFGNGFSVANLKNFRHFYLTFPDFEKSYTPCSLLSWSHLRLIMRVDNPKAREYSLCSKR